MERIQQVADVDTFKDKKKTADFYQNQSGNIYTSLYVFSRISQQGRSKKCYHIENLLREF